MAGKKRLSSTEKLFEDVYSYHILNSQSAGKIPTSEEKFRKEVFKKMSKKEKIDTAVDFQLTNNQNENIIRAREGRPYLPSKSVEELEKEYKKGTAHLLPHFNIASKVSDWNKKNPLKYVFGGLGGAIDLGINFIPRARYFNKLKQYGVVQGIAGAALDTVSGLLKGGLAALLIGGAVVGYNEATGHISDIVHSKIYEPLDKENRLSQTRGYGNAFFVNNSKKLKGKEIIEDSEKTLNFKSNWQNSLFNIPTAKIIKEASELGSTEQGIFIDFQNYKGKDLVDTLGASRRTLKNEWISAEKLTASKPGEPSLADVAVLCEDKDFYDHKGYSTTSLTKGAIKYLGKAIMGKEKSFGGSTITNQVSKNLLAPYSDGRKDVSRSGGSSITDKLKEVFIYSTLLERNYSKDEILAAYLNTSDIKGIFASNAAKYYFNDKDVSELTVPEKFRIIASLKDPEAGIGSSKLKKRAGLLDMLHNSDYAKYRKQLGIRDYSKAEVDKFKTDFVEMGKTLKSKNKPSFMETEHESSVDLVRRAYASALDKNGVLRDDFKENYDIRVVKGVPVSAACESGMLNIKSKVNYAALNSIEEEIVKKGIDKVSVKQSGKSRRDVRLDHSYLLFNKDSLSIDGIHSDDRFGNDAVRSLDYRYDFGSSIAKPLLEILLQQVEGSTSSREKNDISNLVLDPNLNVEEVQDYTKDELNDFLKKYSANTLSVKQLKEITDFKESQDYLSQRIRWYGKFGENDTQKVNLKGNDYTVRMFEKMLYLPVLNYDEYLVSNHYNSRGQHVVDGDATGAKHLDHSTNIPAIDNLRRLTFLEQFMDKIKPFLKDDLGLSDDYIKKYVVEEYTDGIDTIKYIPASNIIAELFKKVGYESKLSEEVERQYNLLKYAKDKSASMRSIVDGATCDKLFGNLYTENTSSEGLEKLLRRMNEKGKVKGLTFTNITKLNKNELDSLFSIDALTDYKKKFGDQKTFDGLRDSYNKLDLTVNGFGEIGEVESFLNSGKKEIVSNKALRYRHPKKEAVNLLSVSSGDVIEVGKNSVKVQVSDNLILKYGQLVNINKKVGDKVKIYDSIGKGRTWRPVTIEMYMPHYKRTDGKVQKDVKVDLMQAYVFDMVNDQIKKENNTLNSIKNEIAGDFVLKPNEQSVALGVGAPLTVLEMSSLFSMFNDGKVVEDPKKHLDELVLNSITYNGRDIPISKGVKEINVLKKKQVLGNKGLNSRQVNTDRLHKYDVPVDSLESWGVNFVSKSGTSNNMTWSTDKKDSRYGLKYNDALYHSIMRLNFSQDKTSTGNTYVLVQRAEGFKGMEKSKFYGMDGKSVNKYLANGLIKKHGVVSDWDVHEKHFKNVGKEISDAVAQRNNEYMLELENHMNNKYDFAKTGFGDLIKTTFGRGVKREEVDTFREFKELYYPEKTNPGYFIQGNRPDAYFISNDSISNLKETYVQDSISNIAEKQDTIYQTSLDTLESVVGKKDRKVKKSRRSRRERRKRRNK